MSEWISIQDHLPAADVLCLVYLGDPESDLETDYMDFDTEYGEMFWQNHGEYVTHWMPLPEPPK